jgi:predicted Zn finger-like uncharacterized protein
MTNTIACPSCRRTLRVPEDLLGQRVKCPTCGETFAAVLDEEPAPPPRREAPPERRSERLRERDEDGPRRRPAPREGEGGDLPRRRPARREDEEDDYDARPRRRYYQPHRGPMILTFGILSLIVLPIVFGPMAWVMGNNDLREMRAGRMDPEGRSSTEAGRICGMIATLLFGVVFGGCCLLYVVMFAVAGAGGAFR